MHVHARGRATLLVLESERRPRHTFGGGAQVSRVHDDCGVLPAQLEQAIAETNKADYGLTAGIFSRLPAEVARFFDEVEAGVCYVNKRTGATTGAWPGAQPFTGWKGSGSSGKGGCGPYYVAQFMREQSRTVIEP